MMGSALSLSDDGKAIRMSRNQRFKKASRFAGFVALVFSFTVVSGCLTNYGVAAFRSVPEGVQVFDMEDGSVIGITPVNFKWRSGTVKRKYMNVRMHKEGYEDAVKSFWLSLGSRSASKADKNPQLVQFELKKVAE